MKKTAALVAPPTTLLPDGLVPVAAYHQLLADASFAELEAFSDHFTAETKASSQDYARRWHADSFHQWSRVWEYPWVVSRLASLPGAADGSLMVLDVGCGYTFLPYWLARARPGSRLECLDSDPILPALFAAADARTGKQPPTQVHVAPLQATKLAAGTYDAVACVSVLEHTRDYAAGVAEFRRVLKSSGRLLLTFDISLDGTSAIRRPELKKLLAALETHFTPDDPAAFGVIRQFADSGRMVPGVVNTRLAGTAFPPSWLPWRYPRLSGALAGLREHRLPRFRRKRLAFACLGFTAR